MERIETILKNHPAGPDRRGWPWTVSDRGLPESAPPASPALKVSVVTPSFNQGPFIEETIRSVLLQDHPNIEYLVIDGGSTDESVDVIRMYENWIDYWVSEGDNGQSDAINKGWRRATGDILAWLNSDDWYYPGALSKVARYFETHPDVDMIYGDCDIIDEEGRVTRQAPTREYDLRPLVCNHWFIPQQSTFLRRRVFDTVGDVDENLHLVMDWEYWVRIALHRFSIVYVPELLAAFRQYQNAKTSLYAKKSGKEKLRVLKRIFSDAETAGPALPHRREALSYVNKWTAEAYSRNGNNLRALYFFGKAAYFGPYRMKDPYFRDSVFRCLNPFPSSAQKPQA